MKHLLESLLLLIIVNHYGNAQNSHVNVPGHYSGNLYLLKENGYYIVEKISPLRYKMIIRDTLLPQSHALDTFRGTRYFLYFKKGEQHLVHVNYKRPDMKLKSIDSQSLAYRRINSNVLYRAPYESELRSYLRQLEESNNKDRYSKFLLERDIMFRKTRELSIEDFKQYFDEFVEKHGLKKRK